MLDQSQNEKGEKREFRPSGRASQGRISFRQRRSQLSRHLQTVVISVPSIVVRISPQLKEGTRSISIQTERHQCTLKDSMPLSGTNGVRPVMTSDSSLR